jgi:uncharacterized protein YqiB (DUF1249 family)
MQVAVRTAVALPKLSRFAWLMGLYGENFQRVVAMFEPALLTEGSYLSRGRDGLDLHLEVLHQHPYTQELRLSYRMLDPVTQEPDPSAYLRCYRDARQAEVTHCYVGRRWQDVLGLHPEPEVLMSHRLRMNAFLNKWLVYLAEQGHAPETLNRVASRQAATAIRGKA